MSLEMMSSLNHWLDIPGLSVGHLLSAQIWVQLRVPDRHSVLEKKSRHLRSCLRNFPVKLHWCNKMQVFWVASAWGCIAYSGVGAMLHDCTALTQRYLCIKTLVPVNLWRWTCL